MIKEIKELRVKIDGLSQLIKELRPIKITDGIEGFWTTSKEIDKTYDSLILSKAWLGKLLGELGNENPYKSGYKTKEDIEPTADKPNWVDIDKVDINLDKPNYNEKSHIEKVDWLREEINKVLLYPIWDKLNELAISDDYSRKGLATWRYYSSAEAFLEEARIWLGFELQRIKEND